MTRTAACRAPLPPVQLCRVRPASSSAEYSGEVSCALAHRKAVRVPKIGLQRVVADVERAAGFPLVASAPIEHEPDVSAPHARSVSFALHRRQQHIAVAWRSRTGRSSSSIRRRCASATRPLHQSFELADVARPVVREQRVGCRPSKARDGARRGDGQGSSARAR